MIGELRKRSFQSLLRLPRFQIHQQKSSQLTYQARRNVVIATIWHLRQKRGRSPTKKGNVFFVTELVKQTELSARIVMEKVGVNYIKSAKTALLPNYTTTDISKPLTFSVRFIYSVRLAERELL